MNMLGDKKETTIIVGDAIEHVDNLSPDTHSVEYKMFDKVKVSIPYSRKLINVLEINNINYKLIRNIGS